MNKYPPTVKIVIALVVIVVLGKTLDIIDETFGTSISPAGGILLAALAAVLLAVYIVLAFKKKQ